MVGLKVQLLMMNLKGDGLGKIVPIIKNLVDSFQILEESYRKDVYRANIKILYNQNH